MKNIKWQTFIPALVSAGILVYEAQTGHTVSQSVENEMIQFGLTLIGAIGTVWGFVVNHKKG